MKNYWFLVNCSIYIASFMLSGCQGSMYTHVLSKDNIFSVKFPYDMEKGLVFFVKSCKEVYVGVFQKPTPDEEFKLLITVLIGRQSNGYNYVAFRNNTRGLIFMKYATVSEIPTNCYEYRPFWVNATSDYISVGFGTLIGKSLILEMYHSLNDINFISFASPVPIESDWVWNSCDDVVDPWASWSNCSENHTKTRTRQNLTKPFEWNGKICFDSETESVECSLFQTNIKWVKMSTYNGNGSLGVRQIVEARSKIKCAGVCSWTKWCEYFQYLKENNTCILIEDVSRAGPTSYKCKNADIYYI